MSVTHEHIKADSKWDPDLHVFEFKGGSISLEQMTGSTTAAITLQTAKPDAMVRQIKSLLEAGGFAKVDNKTYDNASDVCLAVDLKDPKELQKFVQALATRVDLGHGSSIMPAIDPKIAEQLLLKNAERQGLTPSQAGLVALKTTKLSSFGPEQNYLDVDFADNSLSKIDLIREQGFFSGSKFAAEVERSTEIFLRDNQGAQFKKALEDAGMKPKVSDNGNIVTVSEPIEKVTSALGKAGIIPAAITAEIGLAAKAPQPTAPAAAPVMAAPKAPAIRMNAAY